MIRLTIVFIVSLLVGISTSFAAARLEISLIAPKANFALAEPISVRARLVNVGDEPIQVARNLEPEFGAVIYHIAGPVTKQFSPWAIKEAAEPFTTLPPGKVIDQEVDLFYGGDGWTFHEPGTYEITASYADAVTSSPLSITVRKPANETEHNAAMRLLASDQAGRFLLFRGGEHLHEGMAVLEAVAQNASQSPQAAYANVALGISQLRAARNFSQGTVRPANPQAAAEKLSNVQDQILPLGWMVEARLGLAKALRDTNRDEKAREIESQLSNAVLQRFPDFNPTLLRETLIPTMRDKLQR